MTWPYMSSQNAWNTVVDVSLSAALAGVNSNTAQRIRARSGAKTRYVEVDEIPTTAALRASVGGPDGFAGICDFAASTGDVCFDLSSAPVHHGNASQKA
jgi:hypothetical protein